MEFQMKFRKTPLIYSREVLRWAPNQPQEVRNQLGRWQAKKHLLKLKKGAYLLRDEPYPDVNWLSNELYQPSYISLESALGFYGFLPERITDLTAITTLKTKSFRNELGNFVYRHVKPEAFRGFQKTGDTKLAFFIAEPEKAVVDFLYFNLPRFGVKPDVVFRESYRFQNYENLDKKKLTHWGRLFGSAKLMRVLGKIRWDG